jgi:hypothetical protein
MFAKNVEHFRRAVQAEGDKDAEYLNGVRERFQKLKV